MNQDIKSPMGVPALRDREIKLIEWDDFVSKDHTEFTAYADMEDADKFLALTRKYEYWFYEGDVMRRTRNRNAKLKHLVKASDAMDRLAFHIVPEKKDADKLAHACVLIAGEFMLDKSGDIENDEVFVDNKPTPYTEDLSGIRRALKILEPFLFVYNEKE